MTVKRAVLVYGNCGGLLIAALRSIGLAVTLISAAVLRKREGVPSSRIAAGRPA